ncbi:unnamed protein product [Echinostoma caproni]|uniref:UDENN domain-containing protein n=1 Tax=Echinostoma caproni TaxID=27848 RepID=A0A183AC08_9TREM|nr:unnamed protein product [Echinostoma caproni]
MYRYLRCQQYERSLLLEKSIIFYSSRFQRITSCILASLSLLYPLIWVHLLYPLLPLECIDYARRAILAFLIRTLFYSCPSPFIAGIHSCLLEKTKRLINADVRLVDLDNDMVYVNGSFGSQLPEAIRQWLARGCNASHQAILKQRRSSRSRNSNAAALLVEPYLELMTILLGGYREAMQYTESTSFIGYGPSSDESASWAFDRPRPGHWHFNRDTFVASRGRECQAYLRELLQSQMVIQFFESRVALLNSDLGMIPPDDFEDAISRVSGPPRSNLADFLSRGRAGFSRFARKLKKLRKVRSDHAFPPVACPNQTSGFDSAQGDSSSSVSSSEAAPYEALAELRLKDCDSNHTVTGSGLSASRPLNQDKSSAPQDSSPFGDFEWTASKSPNACNTTSSTGTTNYGSSILFESDVPAKYSFKDECSVWHTKKRID